MQDSGYKTPSIAKFLLEKGITPSFPYTRPRGKKDFVQKDFIYDEHLIGYLCPGEPCVNLSYNHT